MTETKVRSEKIRTLYRHTKPVLVTNTLNAGIVAAMLWNSAPEAQIVAWFAAMCSVVAVRASLSQRFYRAQPNHVELRRWGTKFAVGSAVAGTLWGVAGYALLAHSTATSQLLVTFVIAGMCAAASGSIASHMPAFLWFALPALTGLALRMIHFGDTTHLVMAAMLGVYALGLTAVARVNSRVLSESYTLRFENERLVAEIAAAHEQLELTNRTLEQRITERTEALHAQSETLRNAQRIQAVGRLAGGVAHDFNNLLTVILANVSELISERRARRESVALMEIREAATKGADRVRQLMMFSRRQPTASQKLDLNAVVRTLEKSLRRCFPEPHTLHLDLQAQEVPLRLDLTQLEQIITNLVTNARDAVSKGGIVSIATSTINLTEPTEVLDPGRYALLTVTDNGTGMDAETQQFMFDPFFTTKNVGKGTGLGLSTVYGIVQQYGGDIQVISKVNQGTCFRIYLPAVPASARAEESSFPTLRISETASLASNGGGETVLLVEDEPIVRNVARRILNREGFRVLTAESGERALLVSAGYAGNIDLLVTDVIMSGIEGPRLAEQLRMSRPGIRTLFMSGYSRDLAIPQNDPELRAMFLAKPFTNESLITKVRELLAVSGRNVHVPAA